MIDLNTVAVMVTIVFAALGIIWRNRSEIEALRADLKSDMTEMKTELKADMTEMKTDVRADMTEMKSDIRADMTEMKADIKADMTEMKADIRAIDERQRRMENDISFIKGALAVAIPGFKEGMESLIAETSEEERVSEAVGD